MAIERSILVSSDETRYGVGRWWLIRECLPLEKSKNLVYDKSSQMGHEHTVLK